MLSSRFTALLVLVIAGVVAGQIACNDQSFLDAGGYCCPNGQGAGTNTDPTNTNSGFCRCSDYSDSNGATGFETDAVNNPCGCPSSDGFGGNNVPAANSGKCQADCSYGVDFATGYCYCTNGEDDDIGDGQCPCFNGDEKSSQGICPEDCDNDGQGYEPTTGYCYCANGGIPNAVDGSCPITATSTSLSTTSTTFSSSPTSPTTYSSSSSFTSSFSFSNSTSTISSSSWTSSSFSLSTTIYSVSTLSTSPPSSRFSSFSPSTTTNSISTLLITSFRAVFTTPTTSSATTSTSTSSDAATTNASISSTTTTSGTTVETDSAPTNTGFGEEDFIPYSTQVRGVPDNLFDQIYSGKRFAFDGCATSPGFSTFFSVFVDELLMTVEMCLSKVAEAPEDYMYAGINNGRCFGAKLHGNSTRTTNSTDSCSIPCPGNNEEFCGGGPSSSSKRQLNGANFFLSLYEVVALGIVAAPIDPIPTVVPILSPNSINIFDITTNNLIINNNNNITYAPGEIYIITNIFIYLVPCPTASSGLTNLTYTAICTVTACGCPTEASNAIEAFPRVTSTLLCSNCGPSGGASVVTVTAPAGAPLSVAAVTSSSSAGVMATGEVVSTSTIQVENVSGSTIATPRVQVSVGGAGRVLGGGQVLTAVFSCVALLLFLCL